MEIFLNILWASLGSTALIGLLVFLFKSLFEKILSRSIDHAYDIKLEAHKAQLNGELELLKEKIHLEYEIARLQFSRYSQEQFNLYNELWASLCDLRFSVERLWNEASINDADQLADQLNATKKKVEKSALFMEPHHYTEIKIILTGIASFQFGKVLLIHLRSQRAKGGEVNQSMIDSVISENQSIKDKLDNYLGDYMNCLRNQLTGGK